MSRSPHALPAPEYRLAPRVGSIPTPRVVMPAGVPWRQGMLCGDGIASVKFSLPEQLLSLIACSFWIGCALRREYTTGQPLKHLFQNDLATCPVENADYASAITHALALASQRNWPQALAEVEALLGTYKQDAMALYLLERIHL